MHGNLNLTTLPAVIRALYAERKSGVLHVACPPSPRRIFFRGGRIVNVDLDVEGGRSSEDVAETTDSKEARLRNLAAAARSLFASTEGTLRFEEGEPPPDGEQGIEVPSAQWILDGVRHITDTAHLRRQIGDLQATLRPTPSSPLPLFTIKMTPAERGLLKATREQRPFSTEQLLSGSRLSEIDALRAVYALMSIGLLELAGTVPPKPLDAIGPSGTAVEPAPEPPAAPSNASTPPSFGRFELQKLLERDSSGEVYRARDPETDRIVVITAWDATAALPPADRVQYLESLLQELEKARQLFHPGVVATLDKGLAEDGRPFVVTEHVQGTTLRDLLSSGPLAVKHAVQIATQVIDALAYAHARGIAHGRVQPSKVLVTAEGHAKLMGFGMPRPASDDAGPSLPYLAPEEVRTGTSDARSDVYSVGTVCYRMLTGTFPYPERSTRPSGPPDPLEAYTSEVPPRLGEILLRCLARDPEQRFSDAGELRRALSASETATPATEVPSPAAVAARLPPSETPPPPTVTPPIDDTPRSEIPTEAPAIDPSPALPVDVSAAERLSVTDGGEAQIRDAPAKAPPPPRRRYPRRPERLAPRTGGGALPRRRSRRFGVVTAAASVAATLAVGLSAALLARGEPWGELPAAPMGDVSVTPTPLSSPSEADLDALLAGPSDERLFAEARAVFARGDLETSRSLLMELLERSPDFAEARSLLDQVDAERKKAAERRRRVATVRPEPEPAPAASEPSDTDLFSEAESAFARGELAVSRTKLEALLEVNPAFAGAAELMEKIDYRIWTTTLPRRFAARHNHRFGGCDGTLALSQRGLSFSSDDHDWAWPFAELISIERPDSRNFNFVTGDRDLLGILSNKRLKFRLEQTFSDEDWRFFQKAVQERGAIASTLP